MERDLLPTRCRRDAGFSLVELMIVVGIIAILAAVAAPNISQYMRNYRIRGATQEVANSIQEARTRAIMRNAVEGISFAVVATNRYRVIYDDPVPNPADPANPIKEDQLGPLLQLPQGVEFDVNPAGTALDAGINFSRLGALADYDFADDSANIVCKASEDSYACSKTPGLGFGVSTSDAVLLLVDKTTGLRRAINIARGGRIQQLQFQQQP